MASGTPTTHLGLLVWTGTDYVLLSEMNENFATIDTFAGSAVKLSNTSPFTTNQTAPAWIASGLAGAQGTGRWVGITSQAGSPTSGTFAQGDFVVDPFTPALWVCTSAGTPGTWGRVGSNTVGDASTSIPGAVEIADAASGAHPVAITTDNGAYKSVHGGSYVTAGNGISSTPGTNVQRLDVAPATTSTIGGVIVGNGLGVLNGTVSNAGVTSINGTLKGDVSNIATTNPYGVPQDSQGRRLPSAIRYWANI